MLLRSGTCRYRLICQRREMHQISLRLTVKRNGFSTIGNAPVTKAILGQAAHEPAGGSKYILRARNNAGDTQAVIEGWSGTGNWAALTGGSSQTASLKHEFATAE